METGKFYILMFSLFMSIFLVGFVSAVDVCTVESNAANCNAISGGQVVMHLSDTSNAHGELKSGTNYDKVLCCNFGGGDVSCNGDPDPTLNNKIIGLSAATNAHGEVPDLVTSTYTGNDVCYDSLKSCRSTTSNCAGDELEVIHLSSDSNSHMEGRDGTSYNTNICCTVDISLEGTPNPPGTIGDGRINGDEQCDDGNQASGDGCDSAGQVEDGYVCTGQPSTCSLGTPEATEVCGDGMIQSPNGENPAINEQCDDGDTTSGDGCSSSCQAESGWICTGGTDTPSTCEETAPPTPNAFWADVGDNSVEISSINVSAETTKVLLVLENSGLPQGNSNAKFEIFENDVIDDKIRTEDTDNPVYGNVDANGKAVFTWTIKQTDLDKTEDDYEEFFFIITAGNGNVYTSGYLEMNVNPPEDLNCAEIVTCADYTQDFCSGSSTTPEGNCQVASNSVPPEVSCTGSNVNCYCTFSNGQCRGAYYDSTAGGSCEITEKPRSEVDPDGCSDDGKITTEWEATWTGAGEAPSSCAGGTKTIQCPAQIALPFFTAYNFIAVILIVSLIYLALSFRGKIRKEVKRIIRNVEKNFN